jgi:hypothetical protein
VGKERFISNHSIIYCVEEPKACKLTPSNEGSTERKVDNISTFRCLIMKTCYRCGNIYNTNEDYCPYCMVTLELNKLIKDKKNKPKRKFYVPDLTMIYQLLSVIIMFLGV